MATTIPPTPNPTIAAAYARASRHRAEIEASKRCACFFCFRAFASGAIKAWCDGEQTALCPQCGTDSVLGDASNSRLDERFLRQMHEQYFPYRRK